MYINQFKLWINKNKNIIPYKKDDDRSLDDKIYRVRVAIPKELPNTKNPEESFIYTGIE